MRLPFAEHAPQAFDAKELDYVLKPIERARFDQAMARVSQHWQGLHAAAGGATEPARSGNYLHIHVGPLRYLHRDTLRHMLAQLDPARFLRLHRGTVVNVACIREVHPLFKGGAEIVLHDGTRLDLGRRFRAGARTVLGLR